MRAALLLYALHTLNSMIWSLPFSVHSTNSQELC